MSTCKMFTARWLPSLLVLFHVVAAASASTCSAEVDTAKSSSLIQKKDTDQTKSSKIAEEEHGLSHALDAANAIPSLLLRPSLQSGQPDKVTFAIAVKKWYGVDFAGGTFDVDAVITLQWFDARAAQLLPANTTSTSLATETARKQIWLPDIAFTNAAHKGYDIISSSVLIASNGTISKVERAYVTLKQGYQTADFPFDSQDISMMLASTTYMRDELELVPVTDDSMWGAKEKMFDNSVWNLVNASLKAIIDDDNMLRKSRGVLTLRVQREPTTYMSSIFIPSVVLLVMTWSSSWLPLGPPFAMPRIAMNAFGLLCQVSVSAMANGLVPATGKTPWLSSYLELCIELQFSVMLLSVMIISISQMEGGSDKAGHLNEVITKTFPITTAINMLCLDAAGKEMSRCVAALTLVGYIAYLEMGLGVGKPK